MGDPAMNGLVVVDKPAGWTSHDVVSRWRKVAATKRAGHLGTLDPIATGLLGIVTGKATRLAPFFAGEDKTYIAEIAFGFVSNTYDAQGQMQQTGISVPRDRQQIESALASFRGKTLQIPPRFSAKKIEGVSAYKLARKAVEVNLAPVEIDVKELAITALWESSIELVITCSAGTYVRSIAHDLGQRLGCGAILNRLRRTRSGELRVEQAHTLEQLEELAAVGKLNEAVIPPAKLLPHIPCEYFDVQTITQIRRGKDFRTSPFVIRPGSPMVKVLSDSGELVAIGELIFPNFYHPRTVF